MEYLHRLGFVNEALLFVSKENFVLCLNWDYGGIVGAGRTSGMADGNT